MENSTLFSNCVCYVYVCMSVCLLSLPPLWRIKVHVYSRSCLLMSMKSWVNDNRTDFIWFTFPANPHKYLHRSYITRNYEYLASYSCPLIKFEASAAFRYRVNHRHGTERQADKVERFMRPLGKGGKTKMINGSRYYKALESVSKASALSSALFPFTHDDTLWNSCCLN